MMFETCFQMVKINNSCSRWKVYKHQVFCMFTIFLNKRMGKEERQLCTNPISPLQERCHPLRHCIPIIATLTSVGTVALSQQGS